MFRRSSVLSAVLFLFEPFLAASLLLRVGPTLPQRDVATWIGFTIRMLLALASIAASIGLREQRPFGRPLALAALIGSALFAIVQFFTRILPTSLAPDVAALFTTLIVVHHAVWIALLLRAQDRDGIGAARAPRGE